MRLRLDLIICFYWAVSEQPGGDTACWNTLISTYITNPKIVNKASCWSVGCCVSPISPRMFWLDERNLPLWLIDTKTPQSETFRGTFKKLEQQNCEIIQIKLLRIAEIQLFSWFFLILVNSVGGNYSVRDNNIFGRESPALFKILYEESTLADIWSLRPEIPPSLSHQCSSAPHSATSLAAEHFLMSADILRDFSRIKDGWDKRYRL